jgi:hypothetical protein
VEKRLELIVVMKVDDYAKGVEVGDLLTQLLENLGVLTEGVYDPHVDYTIDGKDRNEAVLYVERW